MKIISFPVALLLLVTSLLSCGKPRYVPADAFPNPEIEAPLPASEYEPSDPGTAAPQPGVPGDTPSGKPESPADTLRPVSA